MAILRRRFLEIAAWALGSSFAHSAAWAEEYPSRVVRLLVGFPDGGPVDIAGRTIGAWLSDRFGQAFIVENRPGESGNIATRAVVKAAADGYTLLVCGPVNVINTALFVGMDFNFGRDITAVAGLFRVPLVVEVNPVLPISTVPEFLTYARANPGRLKVAYAGHGTPQHVAIELFKVMAGVNVTLVPYAGSTPALEAVLAGQADAMFDPMPSSIGLINSGRLKPLAVTTSSRSEALPQVPPMSDFVSGYEAGSWFGIGTPRGTPPAIITRLNTEINAGLADPGFGRASRGLVEWSCPVLLSRSRPSSQPSPKSTGPSSAQPTSGCSDPTNAA